MSNFAGSLYPSGGGLGESASQMMTPRIVQFNGKRLCIRLEDIFWNVFEEIAEAQNCKLNEIIHAYYLDPKAEKNKTAYLRIKAIEWLSNRVSFYHEKVSLNHDEVHAVLKTANQPAIIFSENQNVSACNEKFREWLSKNLGLKPTEINLAKMRISFRRSYSVLVSKLSESGGALKNEQVSVLLPGYAMSVYVNLSELSAFDQTGRTFLAFFN